MKNYNKRKSYGYLDEKGKIVETFRTKFAAYELQKDFEKRKGIKVEIVDLRDENSYKALKMRKRAKSLPLPDPKYNIHTKTRQR